MTNISEARIRAAVEERLRRWPRAADTAMGIARWWLADGGRPLRRGPVERVLDGMVADGLLRSWMLPDGTKLYGANPRAPRGAAAARARAKYRRP